MPIDMSPFYRMFFEEAQERLGDMEQLLLEIDPSDPDPKELNTIFRAAHSIKGSADTFSFQDIAQVAHILELLLDRVRKSEMKMTDDMVDALLESGDVLKNLVAAHQGRAIADHEAASRICQSVEALMEASGTAPVAAILEDKRARPSILRSYDVKFTPASEFEAHDAVMRNLLEEIGRLGTVAVVGQGNIDEPWRLRVTTDVETDTLDEIIDFIAVSGSISIEPACSIGGRPAAPARAAVSEVKKHVNAAPATSDEWRRLDDRA